MLRRRRPSRRGRSSERRRLADMAQIGRYRVPPCSHTALRAEVLQQGIRACWGSGPPRDGNGTILKEDQLIPRREFFPPSVVEFVEQCGRRQRPSGQIEKDRTCRGLPKVTRCDGVAGLKASVQPGDR